MIATTAYLASVKSPKGFKLLPLLSPLALTLALLPTWALAQTAPLNDTGQTQCYDASNAVAPCDETTTGNTGARPGQDGRFGRDAASQVPDKLTKTGGGAAGFDFTAFSALDGDGHPIAIDPPTGHDCVRDDVTGLWWEVKTSAAGLRNRDHRYTWYDGSTGSVGSNTCSGTLPGNQCNTLAYVAAVNAAGLCGKSDWRLPTRRELLSIVHYGASAAPRIDSDYFPGTVPSFYWTADTYAPDSALAWLVSFSSAATHGYSKSNILFVRLVRSGQ